MKHISHVIQEFSLSIIKRKKKCLHFLFHVWFLDDQLVLSLLDFSFPALSALPTTLTFLIQQICHEPEIQRKIQDEIDHVVGEGRAPNLDDRFK